ncbi:MAG: hypothetical protein ACT4PP_14510 [Sporichthyaceae bacterium]
MALVAALFVTAVLPAWPALAKRADTATPVISEVAITPVEVALAGRNSGTTPVAISIRVIDASAVDRVVAGLYDRAAIKGRAVELRRVTGTAQDGVWAAEARVPNVAERGTWQVRAFAVDVLNNSTDPDAVIATFGVHHATRFQAAAIGPRAAKAGEELAVAGVLQRFRPGIGWVGYRERMVRLEFRAKGGKEFVAVAGSRTAKDGSVSFEKVTPTQGGAWRVTFAGNSGYSASRSGADPVAIPVPDSGQGTDPGAKDGAKGTGGKGGGEDEVSTASLPGDQPEH